MGPDLSDSADLCPSPPGLGLNGRETLSVEGEGGEGQLARSPESITSTGRRSAQHQRLPTASQPAEAFFSFFVGEQWMVAAVQSAEARQ